MLCQRARQLLAPPRGPLSAIGGIDSPAAGHRREAHESPVSPPAPTAALLPRARSVRRMSPLLPPRARRGLFNNNNNNKVVTEWPVGV